MLADQGKREILESVLERSTVDGNFRERLLEDPRAAIWDAFGVRIPPEVRIRFVERDRDLDGMFVLPEYDPDKAEAELSDAELEAVAGGTSTEDLDWADPDG